MNRAPYADAKILIAGQNVGCGSSREHAVWALHEYGFRAVIAPSFNPIFRGNCIRNGIVPVQLAAEAARTLGDAALREEAEPVTVALDAMKGEMAGAGPFPLELAGERRLELRNGRAHVHPQIPTPQPHIGRR